MRQVLAFPDVALADAERVAERVLAYLIEARIIETGEGRCHRAGAGADAVGFISSELRASGLEPAPADHANATVEVQIGRAFHGNRARPGACLKCACGAIRRGWDGVDDAIARWIATGEDGLACERCGETRPFDSWQWIGVYVFASLALVFDGWPHLAPAFVRELSNLTGGRVRVVSLGVE